MIKRPLSLLLFLALFTLCSTRYALCDPSVQDNDRAPTLSKQIIDAGSTDDLYPAFEALSDLYFTEHKYNEYIELLRNLAGQKKSLEPVTDYYIGLCRYKQLKYLEEKQLWEEFFNFGSAYRQEIADSLEKAKAALVNTSPLSVYSRLTLWKFYKDEDAPQAEAQLADLASAVSSYAQSAEDIAPIAGVGDELMAYGENVKAQELYKIYAQKTAASSLKDEELSAQALSFKNQGNLGLAQNLYDIYFERIEKNYSKEKLAAALSEGAILFAYKNEDSPFDAPYAEKIFKKIEEVGGRDVFSEELLYTRAFNLEKIKDYTLAQEMYLALVKLYPRSGHLEEAEFKAAAIFVYALADIKNGRVIFEELSKKELITPYVISSLYQLGLLAQWENDFDAAKNYYKKLIELAQSDFSEDVAASNKRLDEIEKAATMEYNLKTFLDACLGDSAQGGDSARIAGAVPLGAVPLADLAVPLSAKKGFRVNIAANFPSPAAGCMSIALQYLWAQDTGDVQVNAQQASFSTQYAAGGTKIIGLVVVSPSGVIAKGLCFINID